MAGKKIDHRIVQMNFDNAKFERGVKTTLNTIEKLKSSLKFDGAEKSMKALEKAGGSFNLKGVQSAIDLVNKRFSTMGIIGTTALQEITKAAMNAGTRIANALTNQVIMGGKTRALNIEQAKFMFEGLGMDIEKSMASANAAVKGTAYGLDQAAKAAGQFGASGMTAGDKMTKALRAIAGVASMTSSEYDEIANVFTQVAGQGRLMGDQLLQLSQRGINVAATLGQQLGKSESEIRELVTDGKISFEVFYRAMDNAFGKQATKANKTFTGALSNMRAALSRIGADVATPGFENLRKTINSLTPVIDNVHEALKPLIGSIEKTIIASSKAAKTVLKGIDQKTLNQIGKGLNNIYKAAGNTFGFLGDIIEKFKDGLDAVLPSISALDFKKITKSIREFTENLKLSDKAVENFKMIGSSVGNVIESIKNILSAAVSFIKPAFDGIVEGISPFKKTLETLIPDGFIQIILRITENIKEFTSGLKLSDESASKVKETFKSVFSIFSQGLSIVTTIAGVIGGALVGALKLLAPAGKIALASLKGIGDILFKLGSILLTPVVNAIKRISESFRNYSKDIKSATKGSDMLSNGLDILKSAAVFITTSFEKLSNVIHTLLGGAFASIVKVIEILGSKTKTASKEFGSAGEFITTSFVSMNDSFSTAVVGIKAFVDSVKSSIGKVISFFQPFFDMIKRIMDEVHLDDLLNVTSMVTGVKIFKSLENVFDSFEKSTKGVTNALNGIAGVLKSYQKDLQADMLKKIAVSVALLAASIYALSTIKTENLTSGFAAMTGTLTELIIAMKFLTDMKIDDKQILKLSASMILVAGSLTVMADAIKKLEGFDSISSIAPALLGVSTMLGGITIAMKALIKELEATTKDDLGGELVKAGIGMIAISGAISLLATACQKLGSLDLGSLVKGVAAVSVLMLTLSKFKSIYSDGSYAGIALMVMAVATSMLILHTAINKFAAIPLETMNTGLTRVRTALVGLFIFLKGLEGVKMDGVAGVLIAVASALNMLIIPIKVLGNMDLPTLVQGLVSTGVALVGFVSALKDLDNVKISGGTSAAILALSIALAALVIPITALGALPLQVVALGLGAVIAAVAGLGGVLAILSPAASGMMAVSAAFAVFGGAIALVGGGVLAFAAGLTLLATSAGLSTAALMTFLAALPLIVQELATVLQAIASMAPGIGESLKTIGVTVVQVLGEILKEITVQLIELVSLAIRTVSEEVIKNGPVVVQAAGTLLRSIIDEITKTIPNVVKLGVTMITEFAKGIAKASGNLVKSGVEIVKNILKGVTQLIPDVVKLGVTTITEFLKGVTKTIPEIMKTATTIVKEFLKTIRDLLPDVIETGFQLIQNFLNGIRDHIGDIVTTAIDIVTEFINGVASRLPEVIDAGMNLVISFIEGLAQGIDENGDRAVDAVFDLLESLFRLLIRTLKKLPGKLLKWGKKAWEGFKEGFEDFKEDIWPTIKDLIKRIGDGLIGLPGKLLKAGKDAIEGFIDGVREKIGGAAEAVKDVAKSAVKAAKDNLDIHSPSKVFRLIGNQTIEGYIKGIIDKQGDVIRAMNLILEPTSQFSKSIMKHMKVGSDAVKQFYKDLKDNAANDAVFNKAIKNMALSMDAFTKSLYKNSEYYKQDKDNIKQLENEYKNLQKEEKNLRKEQSERHKEYLKAQKEVKKSKQEEKKEKEKEKQESDPKNDPLLKILEEREKKTKKSAETTKVVGGSIVDTAKKVVENITKGDKKQQDSSKKTAEVKKKSVDDILKADQKSEKSSKSASESRKKSADSEKKSYEESTKNLKKNLSDQEKIRKKFAENEKQIIENQKKALKEWQDGIKDILKSYLDLSNLNFETGINLTEAFTIDTSLTTKEALKNSNDNLEAYRKWLKDLKKLSKMGYDDAIVQTVKEAGYENQTYLNALMGATKSEVNKFNKDMRESQKLSADQVIADAKQRMDQVKKWSTNIQKMAVMGFSQSLIKSLVEAGPEANAEIVSIYANMTAEQAKQITSYEKNTEKALNKVINQLTYTTALAGSNAASKSASEFVESYSETISEDLSKEASAAAKKGLLGLEIEVSNESKKSGKKSGKKAVSGFILGMKEEKKSVEKASEEITETFAKGLREVDSMETSGSMMAAKVISDFKNSGRNIGEAVGDGISEGIENGTDKATTSVETFYDKVKSSIEGYIDPLKVSVATGVDIFKEFTISTELTGDKLLDNMKSQVEGVRQWKNDLNALANGGLAPEIINKLRELGISSAEQIAAFKNMTLEQIKEANTAMTEALALSAEQVLEEQRTKTEQALKWSEDMAKLAGKGISEGLLKGLAEQGVDGSSQMVAAYLTMTPKQIEELNANYEAAMEVPDKVAKAIDKSYSDAGSAAIGKFANAVSTISSDQSKDKESINVAMEEMTEELHENTTEAFHNTGIEADKELADALMRNKNQPIYAASKVSSSTYNSLTTNLNYYSGSKIGLDLTSGLASGILDGMSGVINAAIEVAKAAIDAANDTLEIHSPSRVFDRIGRLSMVGFTNGILHSGIEAVNQGKSIMRDLINSTQNAIDKANLIIGDTIDISPVITPVINLDEANAGIRRLNSSLTKENVISMNKELSRASLNSKSTDSVNNRGVVENNYNFVQNNYSPEALSRIDIYRQTKSQFSRFRRAVENA